jgi:hypothetical protein
MRKLVCKSGIGICVALLSSAACAATQEELLGTHLGQIQVYALIAFIIIVIAGVYFMRSRDKHQTPLNEIFEESRPIHSVAACTDDFTGEISGWLIVAEELPSHFRCKSADAFGLFLHTQGRPLAFP